MMETMEDRVLGAWIGLAIGDAMGGAVRGVKPETIRQIFGAMDGFKDVRPFIGKGIRHYKMPGLYGVETQAALAVADSLLRCRGIDRKDLTRLLGVLAKSGPEGYFGAFRHAGNPFRAAVLALPRTAADLPAEGREFTAEFISMAVPIALYRRDDADVMLQECITLGAWMSRHPWEVVGLATLAFLVHRMLAMEPPEEFCPIDDTAARALLKDAALWAARAGESYRISPACPAEEFAPRVWAALGETFAALEADWGGPLEDLEALITRKASEAMGLAVCHSSQAYVLTLLPLSLTVVLRASSGFSEVLTQALNRGRAADKMGAFTGALAGALYGAAAIPAPWKAGLVNARELKIRGEALYECQLPKGAKGLLEMEQALTAKEFEEARRHIAKGRAKPGKKAAPAVVEPEEQGRGSRLVPGKEDTARWRKFQKEKTRQKRDRRRNSGLDEMQD